MKRALIVVDHGSELSAANDLLADIADMIRRRNHSFDIVRHAHMELARPTIEESFDACVSEGALHITVHPYFLAPGKHSTADIPKMVKEAAAKHPEVGYRVTEPLGVHEKLVDVVLLRTQGDGEPSS